MSVESMNVWKALAASLCVVDAAVAFSHLQCPLAAQCPLLGRRLRVGLLVLVGGIEVFTQGIELVTLLHSLVGATPTQERGNKTC